METVTQFTMRLDNELYARLKESAEKNKRSIAKELEYIVESYLNCNGDFEKQLKQITNFLINFDWQKHLPPID